MKIILYEQNGIMGNQKLMKHDRKHKRSFVFTLIAVMSIFLVESCHVDQMTEWVVVVDGGEIGEVRLEGLLKKAVNFDCCQGEFALSYTYLLHGAESFLRS